MLRLLLPRRRLMEETLGLRRAGGRVALLLVRGGAAAVLPLLRDFRGDVHVAHRAALITYVSYPENDGSRLVWTVVTCDSSHLARISWTSDR